MTTLPWNSRLAELEQSRFDCTRCHLLRSPLHCALLAFLPPPADLSNFPSIAASIIFVSSSLSTSTVTDHS